MFYIRLLFLSILAIDMTMGSYLDNLLLDSKPNWSHQIRTCLISCKNMLAKGSKDMNYCLEGCRIRVYRPIYSCVYEQCNNRGHGIDLTTHPLKYHQCVHLCKLRPRIRPNTPRPPPFHTTKANYIPPEYHFTNKYD